MTDRGAERPENEDGVLLARAATGEVDVGDDVAAIELSEGPILLAVSDGMGGANAGEVASALTREALRNAVARNLAEGERHALRSAVEHANAAVHAAATAEARLAGMGASLVTALVYADSSTGRS